ncbi:PREDICTED: coiled-coil domain-containing protein 12 [Bison bison bison]|uniref:Coiled-coil domain-containing protein 12 n=1 Tax=Bison bison bison TaxID=43346 RepID=A0A6P3J9V6_BISBB|nr:PREDICTED: coiled-coil domain-containing protein 12 [Bison bison bison]
MAATAAGVGRLEEEALRRKERLKALREKTGRKDKEDGEPNTKQLREGEEEGEKHRELRLRNYVPEDEDLKKRRVPQAKPVAVEEKVKEQLEAAKPEPVIEEVDLANLAPRKPDWDLKRDVAKKLEKLEKRTQRAIAELIRKFFRDTAAWLRWTVLRSQVMEGNELAHRLPHSYDKADA